MAILSSTHCHTHLVDGKSPAEDIVLSAISHGFFSMGFTEHGIQLHDADYNLSAEATSEYIALVNSLARKYAAQIRIYLGIERDLYSQARREDYEYVLGASHYFMYDDEYFAVDAFYERLRELRDTRMGGDGAMLAIKYYDELSDYALAYKLDAVAHFDLIRKHNGGGKLYDENDARLIARERLALEKIYESGALLEVNTGGMARGYLDTPYPTMRALKYWHALGGRITIGSDCHFAEYIAFGYDALPEYLRAAGFEAYWALNPGKGDIFIEKSL